MRVLFIAAGDGESNSALHTIGVARAMQRWGVECGVMFRGDDDFAFADGRGPDLIHAWTPREHVRRATERYGCPYIVHLEDNEEAILADMIRPFPYGELAALPARIVDEVMPPFLSHPKRYKWFLEGAAGVTALIDKLLEFKPETVPGVVFWPGFEEGILRAVGRRTGQEVVVVYNGNIHVSNEAEVTSLIDAIGLLNQRGVPVKLLKTGANHAGFAKLKEGKERGFLEDLGFVSREEIHSLLNGADVLVQPGHESAFNDYRFPCKLPEFLATGKPVILPKANLGRYLRDGAECLLLQTGDAAEIADKVELLLRDRALGKRIGRAGREFAMKHLNWERNLAPVLELYRRVIRSSPRARVARVEALPVGLEKVKPDASDLPYLELAVRENAAGSLRVAQREDGDPWLYEKWLAAAVERALRLRAPRIEIAGWRDEPAWIAATDRGYAAGLARYLRSKGLPISECALARGV